jgi:hypothetical protein
MTRTLKRPEIEKRLAIAEAFEADGGLTYAAVKARFHTSSRVVSSAQLRKPEAWRRLLGGTGSAETTSADGSGYQHVAFDIVETRAGVAVTYKSREQGRTDWTTHDSDTTLATLLDELGRGMHGRVSLLDRGRGIEPNTWSCVAVFSQHVA